jgi:AraC family transcriptional regulator
MQGPSILHIKGMVCQRCITTIHDELTAIGMLPTRVSLGEVEFRKEEKVPETSTIEQVLKRHGFSLVEDRNKKIVGEVKQLVSKTYGGDFDFPYEFRFSSMIARHLNKDYDTISSIFSSLEGITLERYIISFRIEKVKELLVYSSLSLEDIAFRLGFSSAPHLSRQFKTVTGINPSHFRKIRQMKNELTGGRQNHEQ